MVNMMQALAVFCVQLFYVFLLGFQSRNVRDGQYGAAACTSTLLGIAGIFITPMVVKAALIDPRPEVLMAYVAAGPCGICFAMWFHDRWNGRLKP
jgi:hypothetical protein